MSVVSQSVVWTTAKETEFSAAYEPIAWQELYFLPRDAYA